MNQREIGSTYEQAVLKALEKRGYRIIERNFRCRMGEIDLIGIDGFILAFIEVKYRKNIEKGWPQEAVGYRKQKVICRVADYFILKHPEYQHYQIRFDVAAVLGTKWKLLKHAFEYQEEKKWN